MRPAELKQCILERLQSAAPSALRAQDLRVSVGPRRQGYKRIRRCLEELIREGSVVRVGSDRYGLGREKPRVSGHLTLLRSGDGVVRGDHGSVFIPRRCLARSLPGDQVVVRATSRGRRKAPSHVPEAEGQILQVVQRSRRDVVGTLRHRGSHLWVVPLDPAYKLEFIVPDARGAQPGDRVLVRFTEWPDHRGAPAGEIVGVIGPEDQPSLDTHAVIRHFGLSERFPAAVVREAEQAVNDLDRPGPREDLRGLPVLTIDPVQARDFDDALSLTTDEAGHRVLGVHIADVSHFVRPGSALDEEARRRGNSVYFPDRVIPMLPEALSNGVCSLQPGEDRLAVSVFLTFDASGRVMARRFARTWICSQCRLTYDQVMSILREGARADGTGEVSFEMVALLQSLHALAQQLRRRRFARHALDLDISECEIVLDAHGAMTGVRIVPNDPSHQLVEECMVAANEAVALELTERGYPMIYRIHEPPDEDKMEAARAELVAMGLRPGDLTQRPALARFLRSLEGDPRADDARLMVLRSLNRAVYSAVCREHFGLAKPCYTHFTSPIRRYPDLVVHRRLVALLEEAQGGEEPEDRANLHDRETLEAIARACSETERIADEAERLLLEIKRYRFLEEQIRHRSPPVYDAVVTRVVSFGLFVEVPSLLLSGLVRYKAGPSLPAGHPRRRSRRVIPTCYHPGQKVQVRPVRVDFDRREIDFEIVSPLGGFRS